jgi:hypothetical protein
MKVQYQIIEYGQFVFHVYWCVNRIISDIPLLNFSHHYLNGYDSMLDGKLHQFGTGADV